MTILSPRSGGPMAAVVAPHPLAGASLRRPRRPREVSGSREASNRWLGAFFLGGALWLLLGCSAGPTTVDMGAAAPGPARPATPDGATARTAPAEQPAAEQRCGPGEQAPCLDRARAPLGGAAGLAGTVPSGTAPLGAARAATSPAATPPVEAREPAGPRLWSHEYQTWIWAKREVGGRFLGTIRVGESVALRSTERVAGQGCPRGFYAIMPRGYVCHDRTVTLEPDSPFLRAVRETMPRSGPFPYDYALSSGAPMYARIPTVAEQKRNEWRYGKAGQWAPLSMFQRGHEQLAIPDPIAPRDPVPEFLRDGGSARGVALQLFRRSIPHGSMLSYTRTFDVDGRTFLLSTDLTVVPADRVRAFRRSAFRGTELGRGVELPLGWFRTGDGRQLVRAADGLLAPSGDSWPVRSFVTLTGRTVVQAGATYWEVRGAAGSARTASGPGGRSGPDGGRRGTNSEASPSALYADARELTVVQAESERPFGVEAGTKWLLVSISNGTLVAYDDLRPVYATLVSPGQGGVPTTGRDHVKHSTTPLGAYRITYKDRAATMSPEKGEDRSFWIADVPFTQYFNPPFALHAAYWHEQFGQPMSAGCINASPLDAEWLFGWTEPAVPDGWQGATGAAAPENGPASRVVVRR